MSWYASTPALRSRQVAADAAVALWVLLWLWVATRVHDAVSRLAAPGRELQEAGSGLSGGSSGAADRLGGLPVLWALGRWRPPRLAWRREASAAHALRGDLDLLALRAATSTPLHELAALGPDPVSRWRRGDEDAGRALAALELRRLGVQA